MVEDGVVVKLGRRVLLNEERFFETWLPKQQEG
uniref:Uncharacterized protein n=1 Tax=Magnetococcus massalia (strain MO-1) TaxID=451514 RepID=A0A1S7LNZ7_MAGMO|nr:protein of unknown function [Candidatus Magnetococcus massalia]